MARVKKHSKYLNKNIGVYKVINHKTVNKRTYLTMICGLCKSNKIVPLSSILHCSYKRCCCDYGDLFNRIFNQIKQNAKKHKNNKTIINISIKYIKNKLIAQNFRCALSNLPIKIGKKQNNEETTASLDRIDSSKGYIKGNVQWVHKDINKLKTNFNQDYFINLCHLVSSYKVYNSYESR